MSNSSASKRLAKGTIVYMIGNMMSKVLQMLILPIITVALKTSEYGYYDLIVTTINLVTPVITFQMIDLCMMERMMIRNQLYQQSLLF